MKKIILITALMAAALISGCRKESAVGNPGEVIANTDDIYSVSITSASVDGTVYGEGIVDRGVVWGKNEKTTIADNKVSEGAGKGSFTVEITGLDPDTDYYARAYATYAKEKTVYGSPRKFKTRPELTLLIDKIYTEWSSSQITASITGGDNTWTISQRGVVWSTSPNPTVADSKAVAPEGGRGKFEVKLSPLTAKTTYYIRAYATCDIGTVYGVEMTINTPAAPTATTFGIAAMVAGLKWGVVRNTEGKFAMHYSLDVDTPAVTITWIDDSGDRDAHHETLPVTFDAEFNRANWTPATHGGVTFSGLTRDGTAFTPEGDGAKLDKGMPSREVYAIFTHTVHGGIDRVSELHKGKNHNSIPDDLFDKVWCIEISGGNNGWVTYVNDPGFWTVFRNKFKDGKPDMPVVEDRIKFEFGEYDWEGDAQKLQAAWDLMEPVRNMMYDPDGVIVVREKPETDNTHVFHPEGAPKGGSGGFNYYCISVKGEKWIKPYLRKQGD